jgi:hypothetical protein
MMYIEDSNKAYIQTKYGILLLVFCITSTLYPVLLSFSYNTNGL